VPEIIVTLFYSESSSRSVFFVSLFYFWGYSMMKIYVGGLPYDTDESQLSQIFASYGEVASAKVISDRETGRSKGFGFVEMADDTAAKRAIEELQGAELGGRSITVNEARPMEQRDNRGGGGGGGRGGYSGGGGGGRSSGGGGGRDGGRRW
jgi:cold-inducible RNA-binding protein